MTMTRNRTRVRTDRFVLRGHWYPFHVLRDQGRMAALVPESPNVRYVTLESTHTVEIRPGDIRIIFPQIGYPMPDESQLQPIAAESPPSPVQEKVAAATSALSRFREALSVPPAPVSSVDEPQPSDELRALMMPGESVYGVISRLTPALQEEWDRLTNWQLDGAGERKLTDPPEHAGKTVSERHREVSRLKKEFERLGAMMEATGG